MALSQKGKFLMLCLLLFFSYINVSSTLLESESCSVQSKVDHDLGLEPVSEPKTTSDLNQHLLLNKLEELVKNLSDIIARLESRLPEGESKSKSITLVLQENVKKGDDDKSKRSSEVVRENEFEGETRDGERAKGMYFTKYTPFWSERFEIVSAVKLDSEATCIIVLPFRDHEGLSKYVAVSDERGRVYVFLRNGDVLVEFHTLVESPITAMVSYTSAYKNESFR